MQNIFISYRRDDTSDVTGRISDSLKSSIGSNCLFKDVDSIPLGSDFRKVISDAVSRCQVLLAVVGRDWLSATDENGGRRIDDPNDFVHIEIRAALERNIPVIPILVERAGMPREKDLPEPLRTLAFRNGILVRPDPDFHNDMQRLGGQLRSIVGPSEPASKPHPKEKHPRRYALIAAGILVVLAFLGLAATLFKNYKRPPKTFDQKPALQLQKLYFIGIGINNYHSSDLNNLQFAAEDIMRLRETLRSYNPPSREIDFTALINSEATRERIFAEIEKLRSRIKSNELGIIAFAGMEWIEPAAPGKAAAGYIIPYDIDLKHATATAISTADLFHSLPNSRGQIVFLLDTCHAGQLAAEMNIANPTIITFASCGIDEFSMESEKVGGGLFTTALVRGMKGEADMNKDGVVTLNELAIFAVPTGRSIASELGNVQNPVVTGEPGSLPVTAPGVSER